MVELSVGVGEIATVLGGTVGIGWALLRMTMGQFEKRLDEKFSNQTQRMNALEVIAVEIKKMEVEQIRMEGRLNIVHATKEELSRAEEKLEKTVERVFGILQAINDKLDGKVDRDECERMMRGNIRQ